MAQTNANLIWKIADLLRGPYQPNQYRDVILPFTILRRLDCILEPTKDEVLAEYKKIAATWPATRKINDWKARRLKAARNGEPVDVPRYLVPLWGRPDVDDPSGDCRVIVGPDDSIEAYAGDGEMTLREMGIWD